MGEILAPIKTTGVLPLIPMEPGFHNFSLRLTGVLPECGLKDLALCPIERYSNDIDDILNKVLTY